MTDPNGTARPDPSKLATEALQREVVAMNDRMDRDIAGCTARIDEVVRYFSRILDEKDAATEVAEREREKAAAALREALARAISEGDERLREHILNQISQINQALESADKLEQARIDELRGADAQIEQRITGVAREIALVHEASERAIAKAEAATEKRFESVNEFRGQLADQSNQFIPREVAETQFAELRKLIDRNTEQLRESGGYQQARKEGKDYSTQWMIAGVGFILAVIVVVVNVLVGS